MKKIVKMFSVLSAMCLITACGGGKTVSTAELSDTMLDLKLGETGSISVLNYDGDVTWSSADTSFATISKEGEISPVSIGSVVITATLEDGETMNCVVEVLPGNSNIEKIDVTGYYSSVSDITVNYNDSDTVRLKAECSPLDSLEKLTWKSSDETKAKVTGDGVVVVCGNGTVDITATAINGVSGSCILRIKNVPAEVENANKAENDVPQVEPGSSQSAMTTAVPVHSPNAESGIIISESIVYLQVSEYKKLEYTVANISNQEVKWLSTDKAVAIVKDGYIVGVGEGIATISAVTADGAVASCRVGVGKDAIEELKREIPTN